MGSTFGSLTTALSSLYTQRRALETTGQNIANANTEGYSRQRVEMQAAGGSPVPALHSVYDGAGAGVNVSDVARLRDAFLESRGRAEHAQSTRLGAQQQMYGRIENIFAEPGDTALAAQLDDFWAGWSDVVSQPGNDAVRTQVIEQGKVVVDGLRSAYDGLNSQWTSTRSQLDAYVTDVNTAAEAVALLNKTIMQQKSAGLPANELADQRDLHLMELAKLTGATAVHRSDGTVDVFVGGSSLVAGAVARGLETAGAAQLELAKPGMADPADPDSAATAPAASVQIRWKDGTPAAVTGGQLAADLDTLNSLLPGYADKLDRIAVALAQTVNGVHSAGWGTDPTTGTPVTGVDFFGATALDGGRFTARSLTVAVTDPRQLAVAGTAGTLDASNAEKLAALAGVGGGADARYRTVVVGLGVEAQTAQRRAEIQTRVAADMDTLRSADAGVNLDEEMTNMIAFQRAYEAASRVLTSIDEMLDQLINRTGLVGR